MGDQEHLDLGELSRLANVTPRTVRFYVAQGLLPGPAGRGPASRYSQGHLRRLLLIRQLQQQFLPLAEIRRTLDQADAEESQDGEAVEPAAAAGWLAAPPAREQAALRGPADGAPSAAAPGTSALQYVRRVLAPPTAEDRARARAASAAGPADVSLGPALPSRPHNQKPARSQWERITLSPNVELHVRRPLSPREQKAVARLTEHAASLFEEESP